MMDHLSLYKGFGSFLILSFTSSSVRCGVTRVILPMIFSLSLTHDGLCKESYYRRQGGITRSCESAVYHPCFSPSNPIHSPLHQSRPRALYCTNLQGS